MLAIETRPIARLSIFWALPRKNLAGCSMAGIPGLGPTPAAMVRRVVRHRPILQPKRNARPLARALRNPYGAVRFSYDRGEMPARHATGVSLRSMTLKSATVIDLVSNLKFQTYPNTAAVTD